LPALRPNQGKSPALASERRLKPGQFANLIKDRMGIFALILCLSSAWPLLVAWKANRHTSLRHALGWLWLAWTAWCAAIAISGEGSMAGFLYSAYYVALCMTVCAGIAVFGARQPGAGAWNFVVAGLLVINLLPLAEAALAGSGPQLSNVRSVWIATLIAASIANYVFTGLALAALLAFFSCGGVLAWLFAGPHRDWWLDLNQVRHVCDLGVGAVPWLALVAQKRRRRPVSEFDSQWRGFRDRYGFVWAELVRQQFNRSAHHHGWPAVLHWDGRRDLSDLTGAKASEQEMLATLGALLKRFGTGTEK
jgi:hypothetical protein